MPTHCLLGVTGLSIIITQDGGSGGLLWPLVPLSLPLLLTTGGGTAGVDVAAAAGANGIDGI